MASSQTPNYALNQWAPSDQVVRLDFNADNEKLDTALASLAQAVSSKAEQSELDTLSAAVRTKAEQSDLASLTTTVNSKANQSALNSLTTTVNSKANQSALNSLTATVNTKASQSEVNTLRQEMTAGDLWVRVAEYTLSADNATFSIDLSGITFSNYWKVKIFFCAGPCSDVIVQANNLTTKTYTNYPIYSGSSTIQTQMTTFDGSTDYGTVGELTSQIIRPGVPPTFWGENYSIIGSSPMDLINRVSSVTWETLTSMQFKTSSGTIPAGAQVLILGIPR